MCYDFTAVRHAVMLAVAAARRKPHAFRCISLCPLTQRAVVLTANDTLLALSCPSARPHSSHSTSAAVHTPATVTSSSSSSRVAGAGVTATALARVPLASLERTAVASSPRSGSCDDEQKQHQPLLLFWKELTGVLLGRRLFVFTGDGTHVQTITTPTKPHVCPQLRSASRAESGVHTLTHTHTHTLTHLHTHSLSYTHTHTPTHSLTVRSGIEVGAPHP